MKRQVPIFLVFLCGLTMVIQFFVPHEYSDLLFQYANDFVIVIGILALPVGIYSLIKMTVKKAVREPKERFFSLLTILGFVIMIAAGLRRDWFASSTSLSSHMFNYILVPAQATLFSMLAFYVASAAYRAFRARTALAAVLLLTAFVVMLRLIPLPEPASTWNAEFVRWILEVPNMAAKRAILIGVALGAITYSIKILLGIERAYMGTD
jgi:apolipoprotein N-acyltransferase